MYRSQRDATESSLVQFSLLFSACFRSVCCGRTAYSNPCLPPGKVRTNATFHRTTKNDTVSISGCRGWKSKEGRSRFGLRVGRAAAEREGLVDQSFKVDHKEDSNERADVGCLHAYYCLV